VTLWFDSPPLGKSDQSQRQPFRGDSGLRLTNSRGSGQRGLYRRHFVAPSVRAGGGSSVPRRDTASPRVCKWRRASRSSESVTRRTSIRRAGAQPARAGEPTTQATSSSGAQLLGRSDPREFLFRPRPRFRTPDDVLATMKRAIGSKLTTRYVSAYSDPGSGTGTRLFRAIYDAAVLRAWESGAQLPAPDPWGIELERGLPRTLFSIEPASRRFAIVHLVAPGVDRVRLMSMCSA
jgi:hypothetical protein